MKIRNYISSLDIAYELSTLDNLLKSAEGSISFWGKRVITMDGYEGSFSLDKLARKILHAARKRSKSDDLTFQERTTGLEIKNKLIKLYSVTDTKISENWFTRLCNWMREFTFAPYTPRFRTENGLMEKYFRESSEVNIVSE